MFAVIKTGGKQYKVEVGTVLKLKKFYWWEKEITLKLELQ